MSAKFPWGGGGGGAGPFLARSLQVNHLYCTDLCCPGAEEDSCKILPVVNMLMTF